LTATNLVAQLIEMTEQRKRWHRSWISVGHGRRDLS